MAGRGPAPKDETQRRRVTAPTRGEWTHAEGVGWQGTAPKAPSGLTAAARTAWVTWFGAWFAWFWTPEDLPALRSLVRLYDQVERGEFQRHPELRLMMDAYGITPKGQRENRWRPPIAGATPVAATSKSTDTTYDGLYAV